MPSSPLNAMGFRIKPALFAAKPASIHAAGASHGDCCPRRSRGAQPPRSVFVSVRPCRNIHILYVSLQGDENSHGHHLSTFQNIAAVLCNRTRIKTLPRLMHSTAHTKLSVNKLCAYALRQCRGKVQYMYVNRRTLSVDDV